MTTLTPAQIERIAQNRAEAQLRAAMWKQWQTKGIGKGERGPSEDFEGPFEGDHGDDEPEEPDDDIVNDDAGDISTHMPSQASSSYKRGCSGPVLSDLDSLPNRRGQKRHRTWYRCSPATLDETLEIVEDDMRHLVTMSSMHGVNYLETIDKILSKGAVMTTCFSGALAAEHVGDRIFTSRGRGLPHKLVHWSACDIMPACERIARHHKPASKPVHYFPNVLDRLPEAALGKLVGLETAALAKFKELKLAYQGNSEVAPTLSNVEFEAAKKSMGLEYAKALKKILRRTVFKRTSWCSFHEMECPVSPREHPDLKKLRWAEVAGTTCCPWASIGSHNQLMDKATLPCLTWIYANRYYEPDDIVHECSPNFRPEQLLEDLNKGDGEDEGEGDSDGEVSEAEGFSQRCYPKCPSSRPTDPARGGKDADRTYSMFTIKFSPKDRGIPESRRRVYSWFRLNPFIELLVGEKRLQSNFQEMFFAECTLDASMYMVASEPLMATHQRSWIDARDMGWMLDHETDTCEDDGHEVHEMDSLLAQQKMMLDLGPFADTAFKIRLTKYLEHYSKIEPAPAVNIVNLMQTSEYYGPCTTTVVPSLLRNSWLFDIATMREVLAVQHFLILGYPVPGLCAERLGWHFPFPDIVSLDPCRDGNVLTDAEMRTVTGNGFHLSAISAVLIFMWATARLLEE